MFAKRVAILVAVALAVLLAQAPAGADSLYWYGDSASLGGGGTWNTTAGSDTWWGTTTGGADTSAWTNSLTTDAYFQGAAGGTITVNSNVTNAGNLYFNTDGYVLTGGDFYLPSQASVTVADGCTATINSTLRNGTGAAGITVNFNKWGAGTLVLGARDYLAWGSVDKSINVREGKLVIKGSSPYGYTNSPTKLYEGATLDMYGVTDSTGTNQSYGGTWTSSYTGVWTYGKPWNINSGYNFTVLAGPSQYIAWSAAIQGPGSLTAEGNGNGYAAGTTGVGRLAFSTLANTGGTTIKNGVTSTQWDATGSTLKLGSGNLRLQNGVLAVQATAAGVAATFNRGLGTGASQVRWDGDGGFGALSTNSPTLTVNIGGAGDQLAWGQQYFVQDGSKLVFGGADLNNATVTSTVVWVNPINLGNAARTIDVESVRTDQYAAIARMDGALSGSGGLIKTGAGVLILNVDNTYSGTTTVSAGTLTLSGDGSLLMDINTVGPSSQILGTGKLNLDGTLKFDVSGINADGSWPVVDVDNLTETYGPAFNVVMADGSPFTKYGSEWTYVESPIRSFAFNAGTGFLTAVVPEPGALVLLGVALLSLAACSRRRRK